MAKDLNQCTFTGRLGADIEVRYLPSGNAVGNVNIAVSGSKKVGDQWESTTEWVSIVLFGNPAETAAKFLSKGSRVAVSGRLQTRKWQDQNGQDRYKTEVVADGNGLVFLDSKGANAGDSAPAQQSGQSPSPVVQGQPVDNDFDEDLPF